MWVYFGSIGFSQVRVCFVDSYAQAGWQRGHPLRGRFGCRGQRVGKIVAQSAWPYGTCTTS